MRQSNTYVLLFTAIMTVVLGGTLSLTSVALRPLQIAQEELDTKKKILGAVTDISTIKSNPDTLNAIYNKRVSALVVDASGQLRTENTEGTKLVAARINIQKNHKIAPQKRYAPVFLYKEDSTSSIPTAYVFPMFGAGLWDWISGYIALEKDLNTIKGVAFDHKTETPGLGARIASQEVQKRFIGKKIFDEIGSLQSVSMIKGERGAPLGLHQVDGLSGASMTGQGVNNMLKEYLKYYLPYIENVRKKLGALQSPTERQEKDKKRSDNL